MPTTRISIFFDPIQPYVYTSVSNHSLWIVKVVRLLSMPPPKTRCTASTSREMRADVKKLHAQLKILAKLNGCRAIKTQTHLPWVIINSVGREEGGGGAGYLCNFVLWKLYVQCVCLDIMWSVPWQFILFRCSYSVSLSLSPSAHSRNSLRCKTKWCKRLRKSYGWNKTATQWKLAIKSKNTKTHLVRRATRCSMLLLSPLSSSSSSSPSSSRVTMTMHGLVALLLLTMMLIAIKCEKR